MLSTTGNKRPIKCLSFYDGGSLKRRKPMKCPSFYVAVFLKVIFNSDGVQVYSAKLKVSKQTFSCLS